MKRVLHVGCADTRIADRHSHFAPPAWEEVRLDIDPQWKPDIVASITDLSGIQAESFDAIYSSHNIEHLYAHEALQALREFRRVLNGDGFALIITPDLRSIAEAIIEVGAEAPLYESPAGTVTAVDMLYGMRAKVAEGNAFMAHRTGFTSETLFRWFMRAGFGAASTARKKKVAEVWGVGFARQLSDAEIAAAQAPLFV